MAVDREYINRMSIEELKRELIYYIDLHYEIMNAIRDKPEFPSSFVLMHLGSVAKYPDDHNRGKELQRELKSGIIPFKSECEGGAGLWERIRKGLDNG